MLKKRISVILALIVVCSIGFAGNLQGNKYAPTSAEYISRQTVILDAGHGGLTNTID